MAAEQQLDLLGDATALPAAERLRSRLASWSHRGVYFGASSWKYEGWLHQVYSPQRYLVRGKFSKAHFERHCLEEYAEIFPSVCGDFSFYQFYPEPFWARLFAQVPAHFQFGFKAPEQITCPRFPTHPRYGTKAGLENADFLNAALLRSDFLDRLLPYQPKIGYIVFEFPRFHHPTAEFNARFLDQLSGFLARLPAGFRYGVELRTDKLLGPAYFDCLRSGGVAHVFNSWTHMPPIGEQLSQPGVFTSNAVIARVLLKPGRLYEQAVAAFHPYSEVRDDYPQGYRDVARVVQAARDKSATNPIYVAVNNRFVGNAIHAIAAIVDVLEAESLPSAAGAAPA